MFGGIFILAAAVYGAAAHLSRNEFAQRNEVCEALKSIGAPYVRMDFDWVAMEPKPGCWQFEKMDAVMETASSAGIAVLPILGYNTHYAKRAYEHLDLWTNYVTTVLTRYAGKIPVVEVWNEENWQPFWKNPNPTNYCALLKATYRAVKAVDPSIRVSVGGLAGVPLDYIKGLYAAGAKGYFDIMSVHPYCQPYQPEGTVDVKLEALRSLLAEYGDSPSIWITEIGWPTPSHKPVSRRLIQETLLQIDSQRRAWRTLYIDCCTESEAPNSRVIDMLRHVLPEGSEVDGVAPGRAAAALSSGKYQLCVYPFSEDWPGDTIDAVQDFVAKGGALMDFGSMTMMYGYATNACGALVKDKSIKMDKSTRKLRVEPLAWWYCKELPRSMPVRFTSGDETLVANCFFGDRWLKVGDRMIPVLSGTTNGIQAVGACVYRFNSDWKGAIAVSGVREPRAMYGVDEERQANYTLRALGIAAGVGVEGFFFYECADSNRDAYNPESHFGMFHSDFSEKPVVRYVRRFTIERPKGSKPVSGEWKNVETGLFYPQWEPPSGLASGMIWTTGNPRNVSLMFDGEGISFRDANGARVDGVANGRTFRIRVSDVPVFFSGGRLLSVKNIKE
jgi:hypothetical protein